MSILLHFTIPYAVILLFLKNYLRYLNSDLTKTLSSACSKRCKKNFANSFKNKVSRVEQTDRKTDRQTDRPTLNFININFSLETRYFVIKVYQFNPLIRAKYRRGLLSFYKWLCIFSI